MWAFTRTQQPVKREHPLVGCSRNSLTRGNVSTRKEPPQVKEGTLHSRPAYPAHRLETHGRGRSTRRSPRSARPPCQQALPMSGQIQSRSHDALTFEMRWLLVLTIDRRVKRRGRVHLECHVEPGSSCHSRAAHRRNLAHGEGRRRHLRGIAPRTATARQRTKPSIPKNGTWRGRLTRGDRCGWIFARHLTSHPRTGDPWPAH